MWRKHVRNGDSLFRHVIFPLAFDKRDCVLVSRKLFNLTSVGRTILGSVAWDRYVPTPRSVEGYGCRLADGINRRKIVDGKLKEKNRHIYCGAYQINAEAIRALGPPIGIDEISSAEVVDQVENGEVSHCNMEFTLQAGWDGDEEGTKTAIGDRLWYACRGPLRHVCSNDSDLQPHPSKNLARGPLGVDCVFPGRAVTLWRLLMLTRISATRYARDRFAGPHR